ncbi:MAG: hypothetical protein KKH41_08260 [Candidatus Thermoplasmatota archaeon]|nr:hypothetical protein [Euryarchaeota archaeon]MBU4032206.1 hypothetical protein [Candidatus Thermoplasmatota archaeon]MBU4071812.1 hypothetical protein [Candidatus Thermoplasmatota archaeon]MBU4143951.1 hypothetical protein [Candidatus Thermoplasmatota archaeon]MBU4592558.1 hypothetical protein [Candidatus Thermoplasmatota archaeon]
MDSKIFITGAVKGLVSEGQRIAALIESIRPDTVAISLNREGLGALGEMDIISKSRTGPVNIEEIIYMRGLSDYGEVVKPPPCFSVALDTASKVGISVVALDMDDEHYTAAYCKYVSTLDMIRQGNSQKRFSKHIFRAETPEGFVLEWDRLVNRFPGYRQLERAREYWMAKGICRVAGKYKKPMAIIELERVAGLKTQLSKMNCEYDSVH